ncbi:MAG: sigma-70 family RNA polymerase sigma factor [Pseudomonadota bacterium]
MTNELAETFERDRRVLLAIACRIVEDQSVAEEIVQESWLRWHGRDYKQSDARPIFRQIVANLARDWRRSRTAEFGALSELYQRRSFTPSTEAVVIARSELAAVVRTLRRLPKRNVRAFRMRVIDGMTYQQIGDRLGVSVSHTHGLVEQVMVEIGLALES